MNQDASSQAVPRLLRRGFATVAAAATALAARPAAALRLPSSRRDDHRRGGAPVSRPSQLSAAARKIHLADDAQCGRRCGGQPVRDPRRPRESQGSSGNLRVRSTGTFIRAFGSEFQGGGHGIEIRKEGNEEFLYVCGYQGVKSFAKMTPTGEIVWYRQGAIESGTYAPGEDVSTKPNWSRQGFLPTNFAFLDDGGFLLADGYGSFKIHRYDKDAKWVSAFGGAGRARAHLTRPTESGSTGGPPPTDRAKEPTVVVCDRAHEHRADPRHGRHPQGNASPASACRPTSTRGRT